MHLVEESLQWAHAAARTRSRTKLRGGGKCSSGASLGARGATIVLECAGPAELGRDTEAARLHGSDAGAALLRNFGGCRDAGVVSGDVEGALDDARLDAGAAEGDCFLRNGAGGGPA